MPLPSGPLSGYGRCLYERRHRALLQGGSLPVALDRAAQFILQGIRATFGYQGDNREGILLERVLPNLNLPIQSSTYELL